MRTRSSELAQIPTLLRERGPLASLEIIEALAMEPVKVLQALWRTTQSKELVIVDWRVGLDAMGRLKLLRVYGVAGVHEACDPAREEEVRREHGVGLRKDKRNYTYPPGTFLAKQAPCARTKSGSGHVAGPPYHRGLKWFVDYR